MTLCDSLRLRSELHARDDVWRGEDMCIGNWKRHGLRGLPWPTTSSLAETSYYGLCDDCEQGYGITFLLLRTWYTNFMFILTNYIKLNSSTCFDRNPLIIRKSTTQIVHMQPLVSSLSASDPDGHLQRVTIPEAAYVQFASLISWWWADCARNM